MGRYLRGGRPSGTRRIWNTDASSFVRYGGNDECDVVESTGHAIVAVMRTRENGRKDVSPQVVIFHIEDDMVCDAYSADATKNNVEVLCEVARGEERMGAEIDWYGCELEG